MSILKKNLKRPHPESGRRVAYLVRVEGKRDPITGKRKQYSKQVPTMEKAKKLEAEWTAEIARGTALVPSKTTVGQLLDEYLRIEVPKTVRPENRQPYVSVIERHIKPMLGDILVQSLTVEHVEKLLSDMQEAGLSSSLITKTRMRLGSALKMAMRWGGFVNVNVAALAKPPKITYKRGAIWTPEEIAAFLDEASAIDEASKRPIHPHWPLWLLMVETGARTSELLGIRWPDVNLHRGTLRLGSHVVRLMKGTPILKEGGKSASATRTISLTPRTISELKTWRTTWLKQKDANGENWNPNELVFATEKGTPFSANNLRRDFDRIVSMAEVTPITPHAIRKAAITYALANGGSPKAVASRVGHADARVTLDVYSQVTASQDQQLLDIVSSIVPQKSATPNVDDLLEVSLPAPDQSPT